MPGRRNDLPNVRLLRRSPREDIPNISVQNMECAALFLLHSMFFRYRYMRKAMAGTGRDFDILFMRRTHAEAPFISQCLDSRAKLVLLGICVSPRDLSGSITHWQNFDSDNPAPQHANFSCPCIKSAVGVNTTLTATMISASA